MVATLSEGFLTAKKGPLPVWGWGAVGLGVAYAYSKYKAKKSTGAAASTTTPTTATTAGEPATGAPYFVIENNEPGGLGGHSVPVSPTQPAPPPVTTPPGTTTTPPTNTGPSGPVIQGGNPPAGPGGPIAVPPTPTPTPTPTPASPTTKATYTVVSGDTLSKIAAQYGTTAAALFAYNTTPGVRPAATEAKLQQQGPNLIYAGQKILIPSS